MQYQKVEAVVAPNIEIPMINSALTDRLRELQSTRDQRLITDMEHVQLRAAVMNEFSGGEITTAQDSQKTAPPLFIYEARYGWSQDIWDGECSYENGMKDVTDILRRNIHNGELHLNAGGGHDYMNDHFWPETKSHPPIPRSLAIRYSYDGGEILTLQTPAIQAVHLLRFPGKIPARDISGCWFCLCVPFGLACFQKIAESDDVLLQSGCLLTPFPMPFFHERRIRKGDTNGFYKFGDPGNIDTVTDPCCARNGPCYSVRLFPFK